MALSFFQSKTVREMSEEILSEEDKAYIREKFSKEMVDNVPVKLYVSDECQYCDVVKKLLVTFVDLSNKKINLEIKKITPEDAEKLGVDKGPIIVIGKNEEVRYTGAPFGEEGWAFIETLILASNKNHGINAHVDELKNLSKVYRVETVVTPSCPYCPHSVLNANKVAIASEGKVISDTVEAYEFPEIAEKWQVSAVPTVIISKEKPYTGNVFKVGVAYDEEIIHAVLEMDGKEAHHEHHH